MSNVEIKIEDAKIKLSLANSQIERFDYYLRNKQPVALEFCIKVNVMVAASGLILWLVQISSQCCLSDFRKRSSIFFGTRI